MANVIATISIPKSLLEQVEALAERSQVSRNRLFILAVEQYLRQVEEQELLQAVNAAYAEPPSLDEEMQRERMRRKHRRQVEGQW